MKQKNEEPKILDFNDPLLLLSPHNIHRYDFTTIYNNIDKFNKFVKEIVLDEKFNLVFNTQVFQMMLVDNSTNYIENLVATYNSIIKTDFVDCEIVPITEEEMITQLKVRNFTILWRYVKIGDTEKYMKIARKEGLQ